MTLITVLVFIMGMFENVLPASFAAITFIFVIVDCVIMIVLANIVCKK